MGKALRWFRALLGAKKSSDSSPVSSGAEHSRPTKEKKWGFVKSFNGNDRKIGGSYCEASSSGAYAEGIDANKHAIAVAAATAAVAEAALVAAQAAAEVVRLTSGGGSRPATACVSGSNRRRELAAVKIQSAFRAYLARRALRALKGLVRLQALVRGHIVRKQSADMLRRMHAMVRIQARACANRAHVSESSHSSSRSSHSCHPSLATPRKYDNHLRAYGTKSSDRSPILKSSRSSIKIKGNVDLERTHSSSNWLEQWMEQSSWNGQRNTSLNTGRSDDNRSDKILEVDTWKPHLFSKHSEKIFTTLRKPTGEVSSLRSLNFPAQVDRGGVCNSGDSPQVCSASSRPGSSGRRGPFTPARSECSRSVYSGYLSYPNYMANTESYRAKVRSQSAPRQRVQLEKLGSTKRFVRGYLDVDTISETGSDLPNNFSTKAYPVRGNSYNSSYGGRF